MPNGPTGPPPNARNATTREQTVIDELYRAGEHAGGLREATAIRNGFTLLVELIETRHRRMTNGFFEQGGDD